MWIFKYLSLLFSLNLLFCRFTQADVFCALNWESDGYGNYPSNSVPCGSNDFAARVFHEGGWIPGRLTPSKGIASISTGGKVFEFPTYEVLVNHHNCSLQWIPGQSGSFPANSVQVAELLGQESIYISRSVVAGMILGGKLVPSESATFIAYEGQELVRRDYEVLTSSYPKLVGKLQKFKFDRSNLNAGKAELIGIEELQNKFNAELRHTVSHGKTVQERFVLKEDLSWVGISSLSISFPLWYGSSDVLAEFDISALNGDELVVQRSVDLSTSREIIVKPGSATTSNHIQICSTVTVVEDGAPDIPFTATGVFSAEGMRPNQIEYILQQLGRTVLLVNGNEVVAEVKGTLNGRFPIRVSSYVQAAEVPVCKSFDLHV